MLPTPCKLLPSMQRAAAFGLALMMAGMAGAAAANDSTASLDTGELVLVPNPHIRLQDEDLYISADQIRVRYRFLNTGDQPITTLVAFPLPAIDFSQEQGYAFANGDPIDVVGFRLWIDGRPAAAQIEALATGLDGRNVTALLAKWGIPLTMVTPDEESFARLIDHIDNLPPAAVQELRQATAIQGPGWGEGVFFAWSTHISYFWSMTFPPGREVTVEHTYRPVPTWTFFSEYDLGAGTYRQEACTESDFEAGARRKMKALGTEVLSATVLRYILTTANNWHGPIARFHLTIDKGSTDALVSLCRDGIRKTGPTTFEWEARDFQPQRELTVLFVAPIPLGGD